MGNANPQLPPFPLTPPYPYNTSLREIYAPYEPLRRMDFSNQPSCLGSNIFGEAVYQNLMENTLILNHKLDELIESLKSLLTKTNEEDLAEHEYREQPDLGFEKANFKSKAPPSFNVYTPPVTYPKEVEETIEIPIE
ncbi:hypothetical protein Tco_1040425, partial [Tanacetum coccineum]